MSPVWAHRKRESPDAGELCLRCMPVLSPCRLGWCGQHKETGHCLVSLLVVFACCQGVVSGTQRRYLCLNTEPVGNPPTLAGGGCQPCLAPSFLAHNEHPRRSQPTMGYRNFSTLARVFGITSYLICIVLQGLTSWSVAAQTRVPLQPFAQQV